MILKGARASYWPILAPCWVSSGYVGSKLGHLEVILSPTARSWEPSWGGHIETLSACTSALPNLTEEPRNKLPQLPSVVASARRQERLRHVSCFEISSSGRLHERVAISPGEERGHRLFGDGRLQRRFSVLGWEVITIRHRPMRWLASIAPLLGGLRIELN